MTTSPNKPPALSQGNVQVHMPDDKSSYTEEAAGALAGVSSAMDPMPHYGLGALSAGAGAYYLYGRKPPVTGMGMGVSLKTERHRFQI
jgi:hypothetical protein